MPPLFPQGWTEEPCKRKVLDLTVWEGIYSAGFFEGVPAFESSHVLGARLWFWIWTCWVEMVSRQLDGDAGAEGKEGCAVEAGTRAAA